MQLAALFHVDRPADVRTYHIVLLRVLFVLMFLFVGRDAWTRLVTHQGDWDPLHAVAWCMFASYATLSILGVFQPLKMLPIMLFMVVYKTLWLLVVAHPLWSQDRLDGSPAEGMARIFLGVPIGYVAIPWRHVVNTYLRRAGAVHR